MAGLTSAQVCGRAGITYRQLDWWTREGLVAPSGLAPDPADGRSEATPGSGYARVWAPDEVEVIERMARLVNAGLRPATAAVAARGVTEIGPGVHIHVE